MKTYTIDNWIACKDCKESLEDDHETTSIELDAVGVAEILEATEKENAKCCYCDIEIEHCADTLSKLKQQSIDTHDSDEAEKRAWHNGRFGQ